ncbi:peptide deformylase [Reichenbachiella versicolor]|uniref:peptide deformylase n=1 Tax=Reichenbachiella versicolor TaxID=1821036 RepID=UPI001C883E4B|nr:peptide deformylase [Reichenbachiella versicolor]
MKTKALLVIAISPLLLFYACRNTKTIPSDSILGFSEEQKQLILSGDTLTPMRIFLITKEDDSILLRTRSKSIDADPKDEVLQHFVKRLYRTVRDSMSMGVGIAAPQVGVLKNIIWIQRFDKPEMPFEVYLNPVIKSYSDKKFPCREGCLSIPDRRDTTQIRAYEIELEYDLLSGEHQTENVKGFTSVIFQHEIDHLNGILYIDHLAEESISPSHDASK